MAVERLGTLLTQLAADIPFGHPDRDYFEKLRERNALYADSASRAMQVHDFEGRTIVARSESERRKIIDSVLPVVSEVFGRPVEDITGPSRIKEIMPSKFAASYLFHMVGNLGSSEIARIYGGKDHTTILNHISRARALMIEDPFFLESITEAEDKLRQVVAPSTSKPANGQNG